MMYTITLNPAVDLVLALEDFQAGDLNRVQDEAYVVGGKGINVSYILKEFGVANQALGFVAGFTGHFIQVSLEEAGIKNDFIEVEGRTRINIKLQAQDETEINGLGPKVGEEDFAKLVHQLQQTIQVGDYVFLSGNTARGLDQSHYQAIAGLCRDQGAVLILDTNTSYLTSCLEYEPFLIKPNQHELAEIFKQPIESQADIINYSRQLQEKGARNVLVSLGGDGALLVSEEGTCYQVNAPSGKVLNSAGAGDSMLAAFVAIYAQTADYQEALAYGAAAGSATAFSVGLAKRDLIEEVLQQVRVERIESEE